MFRSKKFIIIAVLLALVVAGTVGGIALAQTEDGNENQVETIFDKVTAVLNEKDIDITSEQLEDAFAEVRRDMRNQAVERFLDKLVEEEKISQAEADEYLKWWAERPDTLNSFGFKGRIGFGGMRGMYRMHRMLGFGFFCPPEK